MYDATALIRIGGLMHLGILLASALTPRVLDWRNELRGVSQLTRHLVWTHGVFIVLTIIGFAILSLLYAGELASGSGFARAFCGFVSLFWLSRLALQLLVFDARPYLSTRFLKAGYNGLTFVFIYLAAVYGYFAVARTGTHIIVVELTTLLQAAAVIQIGFSALNLFLVRLMKWQNALRSLPLLTREVFHAHSAFISLTLLLFGVLTLRFAGLMASGVEPFARWLSLAIGLFWTCRVVAQVGFYSSSHWRGHRAKTAVHIALLVIYGGLSAVYVYAGIGT